MSLTSYRTAPPRGCSEDRCQVTDVRDHRAVLVVRVCFQRSENGCQRKPGFFCDLSSECLLPGRPGDDRLSRVLGRSTMGAEGFHGRVRNGIGCWAPR
jgi:hypothetical protein